MASNATGRSGPLALYPSAATPATCTAAGTSTTNNNNKTTTMEYIHLRSHSNLPLLASRLANGDYADTQQLIVVCPGCEPDWRCPSVRTLFRSFSHLHCLTEIKLNCVGLLDVAFPLQVLTELIGHCPNTLQSLELDDVALTTTTTRNVEEVRELARAIQEKANLQQFRLFGCLADDTLHSASLDPLWEALAALRHVELDAVDDELLGSIQASTVRQLARSPTLKHLHLNGFALDNDCLLELAQALDTSSSSSLVDLSMDLFAGVGHPGTGGFALAEALRSNQSLRRLHLTMSHAWNDKAFLEAMAHALSTDCTLQSLILGTCAVIRDSTAQAFLQMMAQNCTLELLQLSRYSGEWKPLLNHYLFLNSQGRRGYFHANYGSLPKWEWVDGLVSVKDNLDALYYFLHMNPTLYCCAAGED